MNGDYFAEDFFGWSRLRERVKEDDDDDETLVMRSGEYCALMGDENALVVESSDGLLLRSTCWAEGPLWRMPTCTRMWENARACLGLCGTARDGWSLLRLLIRHVAPHY